MIDRLYNLIEQRYRDIGHKPTHLIVSYDVYQEIGLMVEEFLPKCASTKPREEPDRFMGLEIAISTKVSSSIMEVV